MIKLYEGSGSSEIKILEPPLPREDWNKLRLNSIKLLSARKFEYAAKLLKEIPFELFNGTNYFGDEYFLLVVNTNMDDYAKYGEKYSDQNSKLAFRKIAEIITELGTFIRFIAINLDIDYANIVIDNPSLSITSDVVERALKDCEQLLVSNGAVSGVDRVHTAFHGYLKAVCKEYSISVDDDSSLIKLLKTIESQHPAYNIDSPRKDDIIKITRSIAVILDALNPVRNNATMAHPNDQLLDESDAMLVINCTRTLLHYLDKKLGKK